MTSLIAARAGWHILDDMIFDYFSFCYGRVPVLLGAIVFALGCQGGNISPDGGTADATVTECNADGDCDDDNPCTIDLCREGTCSHVSDDDAPCDDGNACTEGDQCAGCVCVGFVSVDCEDENKCTDDSCDPAVGCVYTNNALPCDDGSECTVGDLCAGGLCAGIEIDCDDGSACTGDACDQASGCVYTYLCDSRARCLAGVCECDAGFEGDGYACSDVDECMLGIHGCDLNATCGNTEGGYECACNHGFAGDGFTCEATVECGDGLCMDDEDFVSCPQDCDFDLVVVIEQGLAAELEDGLDVYQEDLRQEGYKARAVIWTGGTVAELKTLLFDQVDRYDVEGGLLVGDLPAAWYEQTVFDEYEQFPVDIYLQDRDAVWSDADDDGLFDAHTSLQLEIFTSRLIGTGTELVDYFAKVHAYRTGGSLVDESAFIFMDDGWAGWAWMSPFGLRGIYTTVDLLSDVSQTSRAAYVDKLTGAGAEFVYQWIHASPTTLFIEGTGAGNLDTTEIVGYNIRGSFYNLFNCSAARFTEECLAMTYLLRTDYGLATIGSTKVGGISIPGIFHNNLVSGGTWGEAFRRWYNGIGRFEDGWYLGIMIAGDPLLTLSGDTRGLLRSMPVRQWTSEELRAIHRTMRHWAREQRLGTYEEYRKAKPQFFRE